MLITHQKISKLLQLVLFFCWVFFADLVFAAKVSKDNKKPSLPAVLKADSIDSDQKNNIINAVGNVELKKDGNIIFSDNMSYDQISKMINADGNVRIKNYQLGSVFANHADVKDDLTIGQFDNASIILIDGSYIESPKITKKNKSETVFDRPLFSVCPNPDISMDSRPIFGSSDLISIKSKQANINQEEGLIRSRGSSLRFYSVPVFYIPYLKTVLPSKKRESGFLSPSYLKTHKLGAGVRIPYYFNLAPNRDLTTTLSLYPINNNLILANDYRHLLKQGSYSVNFELANNEVKKDNEIIYKNNFSKPIEKSARWYLKSKGSLDFSENSGINFLINNAGDKNYLRDYYNLFNGYNISKIDLDYIKDRDYHSVKTVKIQELEIYKDSSQEPIALPIIDSYIETKPQGGIFNHKYSLLSNFTAIGRKDGMQYRRLSMIPEIKVPYGLLGNLFEFKANIQGDLYNVDNNFKNTPKTNDYKTIQSNYRPELSLSWNLPLVKESKSGTIIIEPMAKFVASSYKNNYSLIPNEDSTSTELTAVNLFLSDRFIGFDRNESGQMFSYGAKSSLFNSWGQFGLFLGQGYRKGDKNQDVKIIGFNDNRKSNIVGGFNYKAKKIFSIGYNFQLNESSYDNSVNQISSNFDFNNFVLGANYILLKKTVNNLTKVEQSNFSASLKITDKVRFTTTSYYDFVLNKFISRKYEIFYLGCCVTSGFSISEYNQASFIKPQRSYNINFAIKNL